MKEAKEVNILNLAGDLPQDWMDLLESMDNVDILSLVSPDAAKDIDYVLISEDNQNFDESQLKELNPIENNIHIIYLITEEFSKNIPDFLQEAGCSFIDINYVKDPVGEVIIRRLLCQGSALNLSIVFGGLAKSSSAKNLISHLKLGYYSDIISSRVFEKGFDLIKVRSFLNNIIYYFSHLEKKELAGPPYEIEYAFVQDSLVLQVSAPVKGFVKEYLIDGFTNNENTSGLLGKAFDDTDLFEVYHIPAMEKVVFTGVWGPSEKSYFKTLCIHDVISFRQLTSQLDHDYETFNFEDMPTELEQTQLENKNLPGNNIEPIASAPKFNLDGFNSKTEDILKASKYINRIREEEDNAKKVDDVELEDVKKYLSSYPDPESIKDFNQGDYDKILHYLKEPEEAFDYLNFINKTKTTVKGDEGVFVDLSGKFLKEVKKFLGDQNSATQTNEFANLKLNDEGFSKLTDNFLGVVHKISNPEELSRKNKEDLQGYFKEMAKKMAINIFQLLKIKEQGLLPKVLSGLFNLIKDEFSSNMEGDKLSEEDLRALNPRLNNKIMEFIHETLKEFESNQEDRCWSLPFEQTESENSPDDNNFDEGQFADTLKNKYEENGKCIEKLKNSSLSKINEEYGLPDLFLENIYLESFHNAHLQEIDKHRNKDYDKKQKKLEDFKLLEQLKLKEKKINALSSIVRKIKDEGEVSDETEKLYEKAKNNSLDENDVNSLEVDPTIELKKEMEEAEKEAKAKIIVLERSEEKLKGDLNRKDEEIENLKKKLDRAKEESAQAASAKPEANDKNAEEKLKAYEEKITESSKKVKELEHKLKIANKLADQAQKAAEKKAKPGAIDPKTKHKMSQLEKNVERLEKEKKKIEASVGNSKKDADKYKKEAQKLKHELEAKDREIAKLKRAG